jgi:hypothetical protein
MTQVTKHEISYSIRYVWLIQLFLGTFHKFLHPNLNRWPLR